MNIKTKSMTGFAKGRLVLKDKNLVAEVKSVNSKQLDISFRLPQALRDKEIEVRALLNKIAERGKVDFVMYFEGEVSEKKIVLNKALALNYYNEVTAFASSLKESNTDILSLVLSLPDIYRQETTPPDEEEWILIEQMLFNTFSEFDKFRITEGYTLGIEISKRIINIIDLLAQIEKVDYARIETIKSRINKGLTDILNSDKIDKNRFEQELIYYIEKIDITEEKVRLGIHCNYFIEVMEENANGRKLNFISQEIGREINTIGSKANDAVIQKLVVLMKDELEKIKEQLLNIL